MKRLFCILALVFGALCLACGACYGGLVVWELVKKLRSAKEAAMHKLREFVMDE